MDRSVALYIRTSTDQQANGMDSQQRALESYCLQKCIANYVVYKDFGISGAKTSRPGLDQLMSDAREGKISSVVVYSFSRFARSTKSLIWALEEFNSLNISFISHTEAIDTSTPLGKTIFSIIASIGELERSLIQERVVNGLKAARARGQKLGAPKLQVNLDLLFQLKSQNLTYIEIGKLLGISASSVCRKLKEVKVSETLAS